MSAERNKGGRPKGARNKKTVVRKAAELSLFEMSMKALNGDPRAQELICQATGRSIYNNLFNDGNAA